MCGILGWYGPATATQFTAALNLMQHRGPDDNGIHQVAAGYQFGHRRLSIIDLSANGRQPMQSPDGRFTITFNGEIYNYQAIKQTLQNKGYQFRSDSDTEVLLAAWHEWQEAAVHQFIGMFAFAIFDAQQQKTTLVRDRFGIKPLYYFAQQDTPNPQFGFASEAKSLLALKSGKARLNMTAVASYFSYRYPVTQESFFSDIQQVPPGHILTWQQGQSPQLTRYYHLAETLTDRIPTKVDDDYLLKVQDTFRSAVDYRMIADVPVGAYLSGGLDSSGVVAQMRALTSSPINSYTIGFKEAGFNEFKWAQQVADLCQTQHHEILQSQGDYAAQMDHLIGLKDAPLGVPNEVSLYRLSVELKKKITVVLSGEGADESFWRLWPPVQKC